MFGLTRLAVRFSLNFLPAFALTFFAALAMTNSDDESSERVETPSVTTSVCAMSASPIDQGNGLLDLDFLACDHRSR